MVRSIGTCSLLLLASMLTVSVHGQLRTDHLVVLTELPGPRAAIALVPRSTAQPVVVLPRFAGDGAAPYAVAFDPVNADVLVAVADPAGSRLLRVGLRGRSITRSRVLATVPGAAIELLVGYRGDLVVATRGSANSGLFVVARNGGPVTRTLRAGPYAAVRGFGLANPTGFVLLDRVASQSEPGLEQRALTTGQSGGRWPYTGYRGAAFTGMADLPTGAPRQVVSHVDGTLALSTGFGSPVPMALQPAYGPGSTVALRGEGIELWALGDVRHPFFKSYHWSTGTLRWRIRSPAVPGNPVDFAIPNPGAAGYVQTFGAPCGSGAVSSRIYGFGAPQVGNGQFRIKIANARANSFEPFVLGGSDQRFGSIGLPWQLPAGCSLRVAPEVVVPRPTDARGNATLAVPIPNQPQLAGALFFAQWLAVTRSSMSASAGLAVHVR